MDLSIITVTWNSEKFIKNQIISVYNAVDGLLYEQIVVDNCSEDKTLDCISLTNNLKILINDDNLGFAKANNIGFKESLGKYILLLNPDMSFNEDEKIKEMIDYMESNSNVGVMSCKLVGEDNIPTVGNGPRRFPSFWILLMTIFKVSHVFKFPFRKYYYTDLKVDEISEVDSVRGSFMLIRRDVIEKMGKVFDEKYFIWFEDVDLCKQVKQMGYKIMYYPKVSCVDHLSKSFEQVESYKKQKMFTGSMLIYAKKWLKYYEYCLLIIFRPIGLFLVRIFK